jgi:hypothetical protein
MSSRWMIFQGAMKVVISKSDAIPRLLGLYGTYLHVFAPVTTRQIHNELVE